MLSIVHSLGGECLALGVREVHAFLAVDRCRLFFCKEVTYFRVNMRSWRVVEVKRGHARSSVAENC